MSTVRPLLLSQLRRGDVILEEEEELVIIVLCTYLCSWIVFYIREGISMTRRQFDRRRYLSPYVLRNWQVYIYFAS